MRIELNARNYKVSDRLEEIINKKMEKFARYFEDDAVAKITMREVKNKYAMEITIFFGGDNMVRSEVISDNMYNNIDLALPKIEGQIRKYRTKLGKKIRQAALDEASLYAAPAVPEKERQLVRNKTIELKKINVDEALEEMELVDHDFFIFLNDKTGLVNVVYRRADGNAGLIELGPQRVLTLHARRANSSRNSVLKTATHRQTNDSKKMLSFFVGLLTCPLRGRS